jgi:hypothetical protein
MMGRRDREQGHLFYCFTILRRLCRKIILDLSCVHAELAPHYSPIGRPSIDPVLMIRMLIVGYVFAIRSELSMPE